MVIIRFDLERENISKWYGESMAKWCPLIDVKPFGKFYV